jgi:hypothetical protein
MDACYPGLKGDPFKDMRHEGLYYRVSGAIYVTLGIGAHYTAGIGRDGSALVIGISKTEGFF